jgi:aerotaxis receptor
MRTSSSAQQPLSGRECRLEPSQVLVSTTDRQGRITHCNRDFVAVSGYSYDELLGQPHNLIRHPDMPPEAFRDLWSTIGHGRPWSGIVKNRCKNGDHYWVQAHVTPVLEEGKPIGYMSVRLPASRAQVSEAEATYALLARQRTQPHPSWTLHAGRLRRTGWRDWPNRIWRLSLSQRMTGAMLILILAIALPGLAWAFAAELGLPAWQPSPWMVATSGLWLGLPVIAALMIWFELQVARPLRDADVMAAQVASCRLSMRLDYEPTSPLGSLLRRLDLINLNMRAIVSDVRCEVGHMRVATGSLAEGSRQMAEHADAQAAGLKQTAATMKEIASTVDAAARGTHELSEQSRHASARAGEGGEAMRAATETMQAIRQSSKRMHEIVGVIEQIAAQTHLLALNAAVEAAHAGDQGRGFAVVAQDVRTLAQRSRDAVREIATLIDDSTREVRVGADRIDDAALRIGEVVDESRVVAERLDEVSDAAGRQREGIAGIHAAVRQLDDTTRHNAGLAAEAAQACRDLEDQAALLVRSVQIFRS